MVGWMDDEALHRTLTTGRATYWSRSRREYWVKGETSGHHPAGSARSPSTATVTPCWSRSTRSARPATPATAPASTPTRCRSPSLDAAAGGIVDVMSAPDRPDRRSSASLPAPPGSCRVTRRLLADGETPVGVYRKLAGGRPGTFLLESAEHGRSWSRWSFVGVMPSATLSERDGRAAWSGQPAGRRADRRRPAGGAAARLGGPCAARGYRRRPAAAHRRPGRLSRLRRGPPDRAAAGRTPTDDLGLPELTMLVATDLAVVDHHEARVAARRQRGGAAAMSTGRASTPRTTDAVPRLDAMTGRPRHAGRAERR